MGICTMIACKPGQFAIPPIELTSEFQYQEYSPQHKSSIQLISPPCELKNPVIDRKTINNNELYNQNPLYIKQVESIYNSSQTNQVVSNDHQCHGQINEKDELSKSQNRDETQPDENPDKQVQSLSSPYCYMMQSNVKPRCESFWTTEGNILRNNLVYSYHQSTPQGRVEQKEKTL